MTLSRINLPSISSVLTSNRVFLPGHSVVTELDMEAPQLILLPIPDHLMKTIRSNEEAPFRDQASEIEPKPNIVIGEEESAATTSGSPSAPRGTAPRSSAPPKNPKHDCGPLASSLRILSPIRAVRSFSRRSGSKTRAFSSS